MIKFALSILADLRWYISYATFPNRFNEVFVLPMPYFFYWVIQLQSNDFPDIWIVLSLPDFLVRDFEYKLKLLKTRQQDGLTRHYVWKLNKPCALIAKHENDIFSLYGAHITISSGM